MREGLYVTLTQCITLLRTERHQPQSKLFVVRFFIGLIEIVIILSYTGSIRINGWRKGKTREKKREIKREIGVNTSESERKS